MLNKMLKFFIKIIIVIYRNKHKETTMLTKDNVKLLNEADKATGKTAIHRAVESNDLEKVKTLIAHKVELNCFDNLGNTPLDYACINANEAIVKLLVQNGAKLIHTRNIDLNKGIIYTPLAKLRANRSNEPVTNESQTAKYLEKSVTIKSIIIFLKKYLNEELNFHANHLKWEAIYTHASGNVYFGSKQKILTKETIAASHKITDKNDMLISYNGKIIKPTSNQKKPYAIPPLIFFVDHVDDTTFNFIIENLAFFKAMGYTTLCFEYDNNKTMDVVINDFKTFIDTAPQKLSEQDKKEILVVSYIKKFLEQIKKSNILKYVGVDVNFGKARSTTITDYIASSQIINDAREEMFAKHVITQNDNENGGTITILGLAHVNIHNKLIEQSGLRGNLYQYYAIHSKETLRKNFKLDNEMEKALLYFDNSFRGLLNKVEIQNGNFYDANVLLRKNIIDFIYKMNVLEKMEYEKLLDSDTMALKKLWDLLNLPFIGFIDNNYSVDAILFLKNFAELEKITKTINEKLKLTIPSSHKVVGAFYALIIPKINAANAKSICSDKQDIGQSINDSSASKSTYKF